MLVHAKSTASFEGAAIPPVEGWFTRRAAFEQLELVVEPQSNGDIRNCIVMALDPMVPLPMSLIKCEARVPTSSARALLCCARSPTFPPDPTSEIVKRICGVIVAMMERQASAVQRALEGGGPTNAIASRVRERAEFYQGWLQPRLQAYLEANHDL